jgi:hypothetical protein
MKPTYQSMEDGDICSEAQHPDQLGANQPLHVSTNSSSSSLSSQTGKILVGVVVALVVSALAAVSVSGYGSGSSGAAKLIAEIASKPEESKQPDNIAVPSRIGDSDSLTLSASDEYGDTSASKFPYPFLVGALLASPYKTTTFSVTNAGTGCVYKWAVRDLDGNVVDKGTATTATFSTSELKTVGEYTVSVAESNCVDTDDSRTVNQSVWVKYVRRELSSLTDADRETFLNAFSTLWTVNTVEGKEIYGDDYKSLYYFASIHNDAGANSVCDEFHGNQGFVNNHMMLGAYLEQSLQLVDPSTCLHYMEYATYFESDNFTARE